MKEFCLLRIKLDPSRGYDSSKEIKISKQNLKKGYEVVKQQQRNI